MSLYPEIKKLVHKPALLVLQLALVISLVAMPACAASPATAPQEQAGSPEQTAAEAPEESQAPASSEDESQTQEASQQEAQESVAPKVVDESLNKTNIQAGAQFAFDGEKIYYVAQGNIVRSNLDGSEQEQLVAGVSGLGTIVLHGDKMYYGVLKDMASMTYEIRVAQLDGSNDTVLYSGLYTGYAPYVDDDALYYVAANTSGTYDITRIDLNNNSQEILRTIAPRPRHFPLDTPVTFCDGIAYFGEWSDADGFNNIAFDLASRSERAVFNFGFYECVTWMIVENNTQLYCSTYNDGSGAYVMRIPLDGGSPEDVYVLDTRINFVAERGALQCFYPVDDGCYVFPADEMMQPASSFTLMKVASDGSVSTLLDHAPYTGAVLYTAGDTLFVYDGDIHPVDGGAPAQESPTPAPAADTENRYATEYFSVVLPEGMNVREMSSSLSGNAVVKSYYFSFVNGAGSNAGETIIDVTQDPNYSWPQARELAPTSSGLRVFIYGMTGEPEQALIDSYVAL